MTNAYQKLKASVTDKQLKSFGLKRADLDGMIDKRGKLHGCIGSGWEWANGYEGDSFTCSRTNLALPVFMLEGFDDEVRAEHVIEIVHADGLVRCEGFYTEAAMNKRLTELEQVTKAGGNGWLAAFGVANPDDSEASVTCESVLAGLLRSGWVLAMRALGWQIEAPRTPYTAIVSLSVNEALVNRMVGNGVLEVSIPRNTPFGELITDSDNE